MLTIKLAGMIVRTAENKEQGTEVLLALDANSK
jgi:hypothetical protein